MTSNAPQRMQYTYRGTYGGRPCTLSVLGDTSRGTHYMQYDKDPGFGPMGFPVSHGFVLGDPVANCAGCGAFTHVEAWPCTLPHGAAAERAVSKPCGTPGCPNPSRWIPAPAVRIAEQPLPYRCEACCEAHPWTQVVQEYDGAPYIVECPDCHAGGVHGGFTRSDALDRARDHIAWHLADALATRLYGL